MSDTALTILAQTTVALLGGGVIVAVIHSLLYPKAKWDRVAQRTTQETIEAGLMNLRADLAAASEAIKEGKPRDAEQKADGVEDPRAALERSAFAPIEDAVREGEERAEREFHTDWTRCIGDRRNCPHEDHDAAWQLIMRGISGT